MQKKNSIFSSIFEEKILKIKRVIKVVKGGKNMKFKSILVTGNRKDQVGLGVGKSKDINTAIEKSILDSNLNLIYVPMNKNFSIPFSIKISYSSAKIFLKSNYIGTGLISGKPIRTIFELGGIKNLSSKRFGSNNILNNCKAIFSGLLLIENIVDLNEYKSKINLNIINNIY